MTYSTDIDALSPDHRWSFDGNALDSVGTVHGTNTGGIFTDAGICVDAINCYTTNTTTDRISLPTTANINNSAQSRKIVAGWFLTTAINAPPKRIYGEGNTTTAFHFVCAFGNNLMLECVEPTNFNLQIYGPAAQPGRAYHLCGVFEGNGFANEMKFYVDGVEQLVASPTNRQPGNADLNPRGVGEFGDPVGTVGIGEVTIVLTAPLNGQYNQWCSWDSISLTDTDIRETLFEKGAIPEVIITNQADLDVLAGTVRGDSPLAILVNVVGSIALVADNITFDPLCSIHVQYNGTGILTWTNSNGASATISSSTSTGSVVFQESVAVSINVKDINDSTNLQNARVRLIADAGGDLAVGTIILEGLTDVLGNVSNNHLFTNAQPFSAVIRKSTTGGQLYKAAKASGSISSSGVSLNILMVPDE